jgi:HK97 family phage portal protein
VSLFARSAAPQTEERSTVRIPAYVYHQGYSQASGVTVTASTAMQSSAVWACVRLLAGTGSMLPVDVVRYGTDGSRSPVSPTPQIVARPSLMVPGSGWRYQAISSWLTAGNFYARVTETTSDFKYITRAEVLDPTSVTWVHVDGVLRPHISGVAQSLWPYGDLWHVPAYLTPGSPVGLSPVEYAAESIGLNLAARKFGAGFFGDGGHPSAILAPERDPGEDGARKIKEAWNRATKGNREAAVLPQSIKYQQIQVNPSDSQFIDSQRFSIEDICRFFGVPPEMIGAATSGQSVTYANREQRAVDFLTFGLDPWLTRLEEMLTDQIPRPQVVRINRAAVLRSDTMTRYQAHEIALRNRFRSVNEVRELEDEEPIPGGGFGASGDITDDPTPPEGGQ